jgi:hypothetical protein
MIIAFSPFADAFTAVQAIRIIAERRTFQLSDAPPSGNR